MSVWLGDHTAEKPHKSGDISTSFRALTFSRYDREERLKKDEPELKVTKSTKMEMPKSLPPE